MYYEGEAFLMYTLHPIWTPGYDRGPSLVPLMLAHLLWLVTIPNVEVFDGLPFPKNTASKPSPTVFRDHWLAYS